MSFGNRTTRTTNQPNQIKATRRASSNDLVDMIQTEKKVRNCAAVAAADYNSNEFKYFVHLDLLDVYRNFHVAYAETIWPPAKNCDLSL